MEKTIEELVENAQWNLGHMDPHESHVMAGLLHSTLAIAQMMQQYMTAPIVTAELEAEPCQCKAEPDEMEKLRQENYDLRGTLATYRHEYSVLRQKISAVGCTAELPADELAAAVPELLLLLVRAAEWCKVGDDGIECPWCGVRRPYWNPQLEPDCPADAILKRFEGR